MAYEIFFVSKFSFFFQIHTSMHSMVISASLRNFCQKSFASFTVSWPRYTRRPPGSKGSAALGFAGSAPPRPRRGTGGRRIRRTPRRSRSTSSFHSQTWPRLLFAILPYLPEIGNIFTKNSQMALANLKSHCIIGLALKLIEC